MQHNTSVADAIGGHQKPGLESAAGYSPATDRYDKNVAVCLRFSWFC